jgi:hypothetical protein
MKTNQHCLGYTPQEALWGNDATDDGFYSVNQSISRTLIARDHLGYDPESTHWEKRMRDFGYYAINGGITRALERLSGNS